MNIFIPLILFLMHGSDMPKKTSAETFKSAAPKTFAWGIDPSMLKLKRSMSPDNSTSNSTQPETVQEEPNRVWLTVGLIFAISIVTGIIMFAILRKYCSRTQVAKYVQSPGTETLQVPMAPKAEDRSAGTLTTITIRQPAENSGAHGAGTSPRPPTPRPESPDAVKNWAASNPNSLVNKKIPLEITQPVPEEDGEYDTWL